MDVQEFDLLYNSASPLFNQKKLGDIISGTLEEEQVPHSRKSSKCSMHVKSQAVNFKTTTTTSTTTTTATECDSKTKCDQCENSKICSFLNSNSKQVDPYVNCTTSRKSPSRACYNARALTTNENGSTSSLSDDRLQGRTFKTRKREYKDAYIAAGSQQTRQNYHDNFTKTFCPPKTDVYLTSNTRSSHECDKSEPTNVRHCKVRTPGKGSNTCTCGNLGKTMLSYTFNYCCLINQKC